MSKHTCTTRCTDAPRIAPVRGAASGGKRVQAKRESRAAYWKQLLASGTVSAGARA